MNWHSPYQSPSVVSAFAGAGIASAERAGVSALALGGAGLTAWELDQPPSESLPWPAYMLASIGPLEDATWPEGAYHTLLADDRSLRSRSFERKLRIARRSGVTFTSGAPASGALDLFAADARLRAGLGMERFRALAERLRGEGAGEIFAATVDGGRGIFCAVALISETLVNLRFTAVDRAAGRLQPARFAIDAIQSLYPGYELDLSGFTAPHLAQGRSAGINRFKLEFGRRIATFVRVR